MVDTRAAHMASGRCTGDTRDCACRRASRPEGHHRRWSAAPRTVRPPLSLRPILDGEGYRPYYVGGYAGASYGPGLFGRGATVGATAAPAAGPPSVTVEPGTWDAGMSASASPLTRVSSPGQIVRRVGRPGSTQRQSARRAAASTSHGLPRNHRIRMRR